MARAVSFLVQTTPAKRLEIRDYETTLPDQNNAFFTCGFGEWTGSNLGSAGYLGDGSARLYLEHKETGKEVGGFTIDDIISFTIDGVEQVGGPFSTLDGFLDTIGPYLLQNNTMPLPAGAATSAKQDELAALIGAGDGSVAASSNGYQKAISDKLDTVIANQTTLQTTSNGIEANTGATKNSVDTVASNVTSGNALLTDMKTYLQGIDSNISTLASASGPKEPTVPQLNTQSETTGYLSVSGSKAGSFNWLFTKNGGTSGILTLYGNNEGSNAAYDVMIGATASLVADGAGVITWSTPYKYIKAVFTTQVGAGSTFDGTVYAV